jgi:hypothetical protein
MSRESRLFAGILLVVLPSVMYGGLTLLYALTRNEPGYNDNPLRHDLWRAGHAHAGVYVIIMLFKARYFSESEDPPEIPISENPVSRDLSVLFRPQART